ncbi:hypothetical protein SAMN06269250_3253 [Spirosoma fluviale]|uniref:Cytochrome C and Quinol oxidase polypeptide I n=1 Tax=Spirosoma fluviale TaxID=1597977 RepID=A0A286G3A3_9BACT|nr:hypothetical protein SAMN06269250_3253 [Spirosoma fluviale]
MVTTAIIIVTALLLSWLMAGSARPKASRASQRTDAIATGTKAHHALHAEHEPQSKLRQYLFSEDHKTIARQYLITGIFWAIIGLSLSIIFRLQLGFGQMDLSFLRPLLGSWINQAGKIDPAFTCPRFI